jgi:hypothetical protein
MKMTLLDMVQNILSGMSSDEVNDIDDTAESNQVVEIIRTCFLAMESSRNWAGQKRLIQFTPSGDKTIPTHMYLEVPVKELIFVNYDRAQPEDNGRMLFEPVKWLEPESFLRMLNQRNNTNTNVLTIIDPTSLIPLLIRNDIPPTYYTSFDDSTLVFDSYDAALDDTLQAHKLQALGYMMATFQYDNNFIPDLPDEGFISLLETAKARAFIELKQQENPAAEREAKRQASWMSRKNWRVHGGIKYQNYGRVPKTGYQTSSYPRDPTFRRDD